MCFFLFLLPFFLSSNIISRSFFSFRLVCVYLGEVLLHVPSWAQEGHHGSIWPQIWRENGEQVWMSKLTNKQNSCLTKMTYRKLLISGAGFDALGGYLYRVWAYLNCSLICSQWELDLRQRCSLSLVLLMISMDRISRWGQALEGAVVGDQKILSFLAVDTIVLMVSLMQWLSACSGANQKL